MDTHDLAWAAGFFDGEGWAGPKERGVQARINQSDLDGVPEVLIKFQRIVGVGRIKGPVIAEGKEPLYYWEATSRPDLDRVVELIAAWLCPAKRAEFERALGHAVPPVCWPGTMSEELAWAGGFFDGEGSTYLDKHRTRKGRFVPVIYVPQCADDGIAPELLRLRSALEVGTISGIRRAKTPWRPYRRWRVTRERHVELAIHRLLPFIGPAKRRQAARVIQVIHSQPGLPRGNPAFGPAGARYCLRGHDKWTARIRAYRGRGRNKPPQDRRQCLECSRDMARLRRARKRAETAPHDRKLDSDDYLLK